MGAGMTPREFPYTSAPLFSSPGVLLARVSPGSSLDIMRLTDLNKLRWRTGADKKISSTVIGDGGMR